MLRLAQSCQCGGADLVTACQLSSLQAFRKLAVCCSLSQRRTRSQLCPQTCACAQDCQHRRPYEVVLLLQSATCTRSLPDGFCVFAVPGEHSRKPGLGSVLAQYLPPEPRCGEVGVQAAACAGEYACCCHSKR